MFRASFRLTESLREAGDWGRLLRDAAPSGVLVVAGFLDAKTVEAYLDVDPGIDAHAVTDVIAQRLSFDEYEVTAVEWLRIPPAEAPAAPQATEPTVPAPPPMDAPSASPTAPLAPPVPPVVTDDRHMLRVHPGTITQVLVKPDGRTLSVQVRHRRNEAVASIAVQETEETVAVEASVGTPEDDRRADFASFGVKFSWSDADLARPLGTRTILTESGAIHTEYAAGPDTGAREEPVAAEPIVAAPLVAEPVAAEPVAAEPLVEEPVVAAPIVQPERVEQRFREGTSQPARDAAGHPRRTPFMLMLLIAVALAFVLSRRTRQR